MTNAFNIAVKLILNLKPFGNFTLAFADLKGLRKNETRFHPDYRFQYGISKARYIVLSKAMKKAGTDILISEDNADNPVFYTIIHKDGEAFIVVINPELKVLNHYRYGKTTESLTPC